MVKLAAARGVLLEVASAVTGSQPAVGAATTGIRFTERMAGKAIAAAGGAQSEASFVVTLIADDLDELIKTREHEADVVGTISLPALSDEPMTIEGGRWNLFTDDTVHVDTKLMVYELPIMTTDGSRHFSGRKTVQRTWLRPLHDTTTTAAIRGDRTEAGPVSEKHIRPTDFIHQLRVMTITGAPNLEQRARPYYASANILAAPCSQHSAVPSLGILFRSRDSAHQAAASVGLPEVHASRPR
jgi:cholesterol oxidase